MHSSLYVIVTVEVKARVVTVEGPLGKLTRAFKHMSLDIAVVEEDGKKFVKVDLWFGNRENVASVRTITSHINNMMTGVTKGFKYTMRFCYAHFPINVSTEQQGSKEVVKISNFLGEKRVRKVELMEGVKYFKTDKIKDQIEISGTDINKVSLSCARISQSCAVRKKDIRKFLDGIYVSEKGLMKDDD